MAVRPNTAALCQIAKGLPLLRKFTVKDVSPLHGFVRNILVGQPHNKIYNKEGIMQRIKRYKQSPMRRLNVEMSADLCEEVENAAQRSGISRAEYIRKALADSVQRIPALTH